MFDVGIFVIDHIFYALDDAIDNSDILKLLPINVADTVLSTCLQTAIQINHSGISKQLKPPQSIQPIPLSMEVMASNSGKFEQYKKKIFKSLQKNHLSIIKKPFNTVVSKIRQKNYSTICYQLSPQIIKQQSRFQQRMRKIVEQKQRIRAQRIRKKQLKQQNSRMSKIDDANIIPFDYSGQLLTLSTIQYKRNIYSKFRYSVDSTLQCSQPKKTKVQLAKIKQRTKHSTALKQKPAGDIPDGFIGTRQMPVPKQKIQRYQKKSQYRNRCKRFNAYTKGMRLPRIFVQQ